MVVGGFGPWVTVLGFSVSGTEGDGWFVIVAGAVAAGLLFWHDAVPALWRLVLAAIAGVVGFGVAVYDWSQVESIASESEEQLEGLFQLAVSPGWGLILAAIASASLVAALLVHWYSFNGNGSRGPR
jgi:hypothetical protein